MHHGSIGPKPSAMTAGAGRFRLLPVLAVWWPATVVLRGSALRHSQPTGGDQWSRQTDGDQVEGNHIHEVEMMDQINPDDIQNRECPNSSDAHTLAKFKRILYKWRGKNITIAGDSLTDHPYEALVCSGILLGAKLRPVLGYGFPKGVEEKWIGSHLVSGRAGKALSPVRMNQLVFDGWGEITIRQFRLYDYDKDGVRLSEIFGPEADLLLLNQAHEAYKAAGQDQLNMTRDVTNDILKKAAARDAVDKLVLFGHPPQHFDTKTGEYESREQAISGKCRCHGESAMKGQPAWKTNSIMSETAHAHHVPYVEPWPYYAQACNDHLEDHDCTHFKGELSLHAKFVEQLLLASKR